MNFCAEANSEGVSVSVRSTDTWLTLMSLIFLLGCSGTTTLSSLAFVMMIGEIGQASDVSSIHVPRLPVGHFRDEFLTFYSSVGDVSLSQISIYSIMETNHRT